MSNKKETKPGRKPLKPPRGFVTVAQAAEILGVSYSAVYAHRGEVEAIEGPGGSIFLPRAELAKITEAFRPPAEGDTRGVYVRAPAATIATWEAVIKAATPKGEKPKPLSRWLAELAEREVAA